MVEIVNPQDAGLADQVTLNLREIVEDGGHSVDRWLDGVRDKWLKLCGSCDAGQPMNCVCTQDDPRTVIQELVQVARQLREQLSLFGQRAQLLSATDMGDAYDQLEKLVAVAEAARLAVPGILETWPGIRESAPEWFHPGTIELVKAVDALEEKEEGTDARR